MTELEKIEGLESRFDEIKSLITEVKSGMMSGDDCNNQLYAIIQSLDGISSMINSIAKEKMKPTDEFTILQTNILEVKKALAGMSESVNVVIRQDLQELLSTLTEKVNRLEILTNNTGIDQRVMMNLSEKAEKNKEEITKDIRDCVEYLDKSLKAVSNDAVQHLSDDITLLGTNFEKTSDNLKRSIIDIFSRIQETMEVKPAQTYSASAHSDISDDNIEMLKNGIYNLNVNTEQRFNKMNRLLEELDIFNKLEDFAKIKNLPAVGQLKQTLNSNLNNIVEKYSYTLQTSQNREELTSTTQQFRKEVYSAIVSMLGNVSEFLIDTTADVSNVQMNNVADKLEELASVTELNNSGYNNIQIELKDLRERCENILEQSKKVSDYILELKQNISELQSENEAAKKQSSDIGEVIRECTKSIIENSEPDRNTIKDLLVDIKKNISILQSGEEGSDYTYSMQDIESDVAKIRIYLNELSQTGFTLNTDEFSDELNSIVVMVDSIKQQLNKIDETDVSDTLSKMKEDVTSISTRVNKLLLTSDNSYNMIDSSLKEFKILSEEIETQVKSIADSNKFKPLEESMNAVKTALNESNSYNSVINQSLIMLAEWVDNAGELITNIHEGQIKQSSLDELKLMFAQNSDNVVSTVKTMLEGTESLIQGINIPAQIDYSDSLNIINGKLAEQNILIEKQEERINKLDEKLTTILEFIAKNNSDDISSRMNDIESKLDKLNTSLEKLTSFVEE